MLPQPTSISSLTFNETQINTRTNEVDYKNWRQAQTCTMPSGLSVKKCHYNNKTVSILHLLISTISPWTKWPPFWQTTYSNAFSWMKMIELQFEFHWNLFPGVQLTISQYWFRWLLGAEQVTSHYLNQCWRSSLTHISGIRGRWVITWHIPKGNWSMVVKM